VGAGTRGESGDAVALDVKAGDRILFAKWSRTEIKIEGKDLITLTASNVLGILD